MQSRTVLDEGAERTATGLRERNQCTQTAGWARDALEKRTAITISQSLRLLASDGIFNWKNIMLT